jgi:hypothetical protein
MKNTLVVGGRYRHFKGSKVLVLAEAKHSETTEPLVVYVHLDTGDIWVRPKKMFLEKVEKDGKRVERFKLVRATNVEDR